MVQMRTDGVSSRHLQQYVGTPDWPEHPQQVPEAGVPAQELRPDQRLVLIEPCININITRFVSD